MRKFSQPMAQEPTQAVDPNGRGTRFNHPAYGQVHATRISGDVVLHGTDFIHHNFVAISICTSELTRDLSHDWNFPLKEIVEVYLSEAQWATFVSSLNMGGGVPCTINHLNGASMPEIPYRNAQDEFRGEASEKAKNAAAAVRETIANIEKVLGNGTSKVRKDALLEPLTRLEQELRSNMPYVLESFDRHMEETIEHAKIEVTAHIHNATQRAGLAALQGKTLSLGPGDSDD